jgi:hypothetical protein
MCRCKQTTQCLSNNLSLPDSTDDKEHALLHHKSHKKPLGCIKNTVIVYRNLNPLHNKSVCATTNYTPTAELIKFI